MKHQTTRAIAAWACVALTSCATYRPAPIDPLDVLDGLNAIEWTPGLESQADPAAHGPRDLAAFAVSTNPQLAAVRAEVGVRNALLIEAGLLPDPTIGWDAMDLLASQLVDGTSSSVDALAGFSLMFPLPRPGERDAKSAAAEWRVEEARRQVAAAEWALTLSIYLAYEEVRAAEDQLAQSRVLLELAASTSDSFERARDAGAATAIQANLALGELQAMRIDAMRTATRLEQARQAMNAWLGLPPTLELALGSAETPWEHVALQASAAELTAHAVTARPDLAALHASYEAAENEVRLAVALQSPLIALGTVLNLTLPIFSQAGRPKVQTALARREQHARAFTASVHAVRQEIAAAHTLWQLAEREVELVEDQLLPNAEATHKLSRTAFEAGEITLLETLALQRALVQARTRHAEVQAERAKRAWTLLAASGWLLAPTTETQGTSQ